MNRSFLGTGWGFPPEFNIERKDVMLVDNFEDIHQSLSILLSTRPGERLLNPLFGCRIHDLVFESIDESTKILAIESIRHAILFFEPRITLEQVIIDPSEIYNGILLIRIGYIIRTTNSRSNMVFPFYLKEGTLL
jgi:phage baseplate assembly protein W